jgi:hypothetical protein
MPYTSSSALVNTGVTATSAAHGIVVGMGHRQQAAGLPGGAGAHNEACPLRTSSRLLNRLRCATSAVCLWSAMAR